MRHESTSAVAKPLVLVVEDSNAVRLELQRAIEQMLTFEVVAVTTYGEARDFLDKRGREVFLAILDLTLPDAPDGQIVDLVCSKSIPCIAFTSDVSEATRQRMLAKDIVDYVVKDTRAVQNVLDYLERLVRNRSNKVLVVEDSETFRLYLCSLLHRHMFQVVDVPDAETALKYLKSNNDISTVIIDYALPGIDGIELTHRIRERYSKAEIVLIGLSSVSESTLPARYIKSGANDFITKPFELEVFYRRINHHVEVLESIRALKKANEIKNQFLGMAVHDLRTPISGIKGLANLLLGGGCGELNEEQLEMLGYIGEANEQMNVLVSDLLDISVIESGELTLEMANGNLEEVVRQRLRIHAFAAKKKGISIRTGFKSLPPFRFDSNRIGQVLDNLLSNAIKFSPADKDIDVSILKDEEGQAMICVKDYGQGIPKEESELLFEVFKKTSVQPTAGESSTGLGLSIVRKIVEAHGGKVWADSVYGEGAMFCFTLPM